MAELSSIPVTHLKGVGDALAQKLAKLNLITVQDLLFHLPLRYQDRTRITPMSVARVGQDLVVEGAVVSSGVMMGKRRSLLVKLQDGGGQIGLRFYYFNQAQKEALKKGARVRCFGEVRLGATGLEMYHPEYRLLADDNIIPMEHSLTPIYPTTEGLTQQRLRQIIAQALVCLNTHHLIDWLPDSIKVSYQLADLIEAIRYLHQPPPDAHLASLMEGKHWAIIRLIFEELIANQLSLQSLREQIKQQRAPSFIPSTGFLPRFLNQLPFAPTRAQQRVNQEISYDLAQTAPMLRLVQGDVGAGKTVVAAVAALQAIEAGFQVVLMAPTEILAEQHLATFQQWFNPLNIEVAWLAGKLKGKARTQALQRIAEGAAMVVGTHALFQDEVRFHSLGLVIIDEQHRFGVEQRLALWQKGMNAGLYPHQLIMTATPIPRTLAMSLYADLDASVLDELPPGRTPITTVVVGDSRRLEIVERVKQACRAGKQAYWVCTLIEDSEELTCQAAETTYQELVTLLPEASIALIHGRMKPTEKAQVMARFKEGTVQLLVATTVIEVGVDVPNASLMIIENPERLGLAQLHQLRGRVGRGCVESFCVLLYHAPLSKIAQQRLSIMRETNDGFIIAEKDLEIRGPGEVLGTRQTGELQFRIVDLMRDNHLLASVRDAAQQIVADYPQSIEPLLARWVKNKQRYGLV